MGQGLGEGASAPGVVRRSSGGVILFVVAIVLSAALLFAVEPMFTRMVLPRFGGSASVWSVAIAFFQGALLLGYFYAHLLIRHLPIRLGPFVHLAVLAIGAAFLPLAPAAGWERPPGEGEALALLGLFGVSIGAPFAALSANAPLFQAWFARSRLPGSDNPYPLYAASNAGSLTALLAYPFLIEPFATLREQAGGWSVGYGLLMALVLAIAAIMLRLPHRLSHSEDVRSETLDRRVMLWCVFLGFVPSAGLVAVTAHLSTDVAAAPFLWVVPLALYLVTFIIAFGVPGSDWLRPMGLVFAVALILLAGALAFEFRSNHALDLLLHLVVFFILGVYCHGRLAAMRPPSGQLTQFYLALSLGGVLGGVFAALVAPAVFSFVAEYPIVLALGALALPKRGVWLAAGLAVLLVAARLFPLDVRERETHRSFFGVHTVETTRDGRFRTLRHGIEVHGAQQIADEKGRPLSGKPKPLTYYTEDSPISEVIDAARLNAGGGAIRIGVVGLGTGSIACLNEPGDQVDFYEIDPEVVKIARDSGRFTFVRECAPDARMIMGDARLTLGRASERYHALIIDAFSSDSIPAHLMTREALAIYMDRLEPNGLLAVHISNNHLRLVEPVVATAQSLDLALRLHDEETPDDQPEMVVQPTVVAVARKEAAFAELEENDEWQEPEDKNLPRPWTDDYANLFGAMIAKWRER